MAMMERRLLPYLIGIALGFCYEFGKYVMPGRFNKKYLQTPAWL